MINLKYLIKKSGVSVKLFILSLLISILSTVITIIFPIYIKSAVDKFQEDTIKNSDITLVILLFILSSILGSTSLFIFKYIGSLSMFNIRSDIWEKILKLNISAIKNYESGELISRIKNDIEELNSFMTNTIPNTLNYIFVFLGSLFMLIYLDYKITLIILIVIPIILLIIFPIGTLTYNISQKLQDKLSIFTSTISNVLNNIILVKTYTNEHREYYRVNKLLKSVLKIEIKEAKIQSIISPIMSLVSIGTILFIVGYSTIRIHNGDLTTGTFIAVLYYVFQIIPAVISFTSLYNDFQKMRGANKKINDILLFDEYEQKDIFNKINEIKPGDLIVNNLSFAYKENTVLENLNFSVKKGETLAIVGPSGAGKSTFFNILLGLYTKYDGEIKYNDFSIQSYDLKDWRNNISYIPQDNNIMSGTILDNVLYGKREILSMLEVEEASKIANISDFISEIKKGYLSETGENGNFLSGGQKQRISFARAIIKNANIFLLDEFSSNLDSQTENKLIENLREVTKNKTTIIIAHRMSTIVNADKIIFMEKGKITGEGTHKDLYNSHKLYKLYVDSQNIFND